MSDRPKLIADLPPEQRAIRAKCLHPSGNFVEFTKDEIEQSIPSRFEKVVQRYPNRIAVKTPHHGVMYAELDAAANRVGRKVLTQARPGNEPVAVLLQHGLEAVTAFLGVLKAGKIFVPIDPSFPLPRLRYVLEDSQASCLITDPANLSLARELSDSTLPLINVGELGNGVSGENVRLAVEPDSAAHIIYTSGSTGYPKGVVQSHRNLLFEIKRVSDSFHICPEDRISHLLSHSVTGGEREILSALLNGSCLCPFGIRREGVAQLAHWLIQEQITLCRSVSTAFRTFTASLTGQERFPNLRLIYVGGETAYRRDVALYKKYVSPECIWVNVYGATETGIVLQYFIDRETDLPGEGVPLGFPSDGMDVRLLSEENREVASAEIGEIVVKSRYIALGYWRSRRTTKGPFSMDSEGNRTYPTGDLGRRLADGAIECCGRRDFQVKVRGNRVETAEVERALLSLDSIKEAVVMPYAEQYGGQRLVAYIVPNSRPAPGLKAIWRALTKKLPGYAIPSAIVFMDALPLMGIGKVDRMALPSPGSARPALEESFVAPRTPVEEALARIWAGVLKLEQVGIHDNLFDLGGHSLLATQIISRVRNTFQLELPLRALFESPTVASLAVQIGQTQAKRAVPEEIAGLLSDPESLSDEEAKRLLNRESTEKVLRPS